MNGETNLAILLNQMTPELNEGEYVFCQVSNSISFDTADAICQFREKEGLTAILPRQVADKLQLKYSFIASWITLTVHSSLEAVGLTAAFSNALAEAGISCNVIAAFYHDHIFVSTKDSQKAMQVLKALTEKH
ncbi:ACT domain-containing protein [Pontibacter silvestris]|uniref:ACT domain-containing protein n=1 Tax=Pontibacter silvestris TaxID=2305183 RepID=A0ABW4X439_9BACT|nr:ACT domain-containing protein [Pontibacter silvestris]MCC9135097.1 ACT domain-containing protein [Pontibacter silvestris]